MNVPFAGFSSTTLASSEEKQTWSFHYTLATTSPGNCPNEAYLRTSLATNVDGRDPFTNDAQRTIPVEIGPTGTEVEARIVARDENGKVTTNQTLHAPRWRCDQLGERIVFVLQDIVDPIELPGAKTESSPKKVAPPKKPPIVSAANAKKPRVRPQSIPKLVVPIGVGAAWWNAPRAALSTTLGIEAQWERFSIGIEGGYDHAWAVPNIRDSFAERAGVAVTGCILHRFSKKLFMRGCGIAEAARLSLDVHGLDMPEQDATVINIGARMGIGAWVIPSFGVELRGDGSFFVTSSPRFVINDGNDRSQTLARKCLPKKTTCKRSSSVMNWIKSFSEYWTACPPNSAICS